MPSDNVIKPASQIDQATEQLMKALSVNAETIQTLEERLVSVLDPLPAKPDPHHAEDPVLSLLSAKVRHAADTLADQTAQLRSLIERLQL